MLHCDASDHYTRPSFGVWAWVAIDADKREVASASGRTDVLGTNCLESEAVWHALTWALAHAQGRPVECRTDNLLVVERVVGIDLHGRDRLTPYLQRLAPLLERPDVRLVWVPRRQNVRANWLRRSAVRERLVRATFVRQTRRRLEAVEP